MSRNNDTSIVRFLVVALCLTAYGNNPVGMVVPRPGIGVGIQGDPAPGRSPGPPLLQSALPMALETVVSDFSVNDIPEGGRPTETASVEKTYCALHGDEADLTETDRSVNFSITHKLFKTDILVPGIVYQVILSTEEVSLFEISLTSAVNEINKGKFSGQNTIHQFPCSSFILRETLEHQFVYIYNWTIDSAEEFSSNVTFQLQYRKAGSSMVFHKNYFRPLHQDCQLKLSPEGATISWLDTPPIVDCQIWFPGHESGHGLVVELSKLNVPCSRGYLHFSGLNSTQQHLGPHYHRGGTGFAPSTGVHKPAHLCGKLEELPDADRHIYFPSSSSAPFLHVHGNPVFVLSYHWVDYCYNVTLTDRNGSFDLKPTGSLQCSFKISIPYGNRVAVILQLGDPSMPMVGPEEAPPLRTAVKESECEGLYTELFDGDSSWWHCTLPGDMQRRIEIVSRENKVLLRVSAKGARSGASGGGDVNRIISDGDAGANDGVNGGESAGSLLSMRMEYRADPIEEIVGRCGYGWVAMRQFCIGAVEGARLPWAQAEMECARRGGHLVSIRSEHAQVVVDNLLLNSPGYREHNAYWIGASDKTHEGDFRWSDGLAFSYTHWFPGWSDHGFYNRQPNDDGLSEQDCLEVRRVYQMPTSSSRLADSFMWNDRDCAKPNYFICERLQSDEPLEDGWPTECNKTVILSRQQSKASVSSPGFPRQYPDNVFCITEVLAPAGYRILLDFEELVLEEEPSCSYDFLDIIEVVSNGSNGVIPNAGSARRLCGDWSTKLKLLRYVSSGSRITLRFSSDYSHHFGGFKARVSMENAAPAPRAILQAMQCSDDRLQMFNNSCYMFVSYPEVTWNTAVQICHGMKAHLASVTSPEEEQFITTNIRRTAEYRTSGLYWLGAQMTDYNKFLWIDQTPMSYSAFLPGQNPEENSVLAATATQEDPLCLGMQWMTPPTPMLPSGLYWKSQKCSVIGGYVCKRRTQISGTGIDFNRTLNGSEGYLTTPNYPGSYYHNLDFLVRIVGPERTRIVIQFSKLDLEYQMDCLYDYVQLRNVPNGPKDSPRYCGTEQDLMSRFDFVSAGNEAEVVFHSDYSISGSGFAMRWYAVDVGACPVQTLTAREGTIISPNYPHFLLGDLDCTLNMLAPSGKRIWVEFTNYDFADAAEETSEMAENREAFLEVDLGVRYPRFRPFQASGQLTDGAFLSDAERLQIRLKTTARPRGMGFRATYKTLSHFQEERNILLENNTSGNLLHLNYPQGPPSNIDFLQHFVAPANHVICLELYHVKLVEEGCSFARGTIVVYDNYADSNGTLWNLCDDRDNDDFLLSSAPIAITSYMNTLHLRQKNGPLGIPLNGTLRVHYDENYKDKLLRLKDNDVESCSPNPCQHEGRCINNGLRKFCKCTGHFTGLFCALTVCELDPCVYGTCELSNGGFKCHCRKGYTGSTCEQKTRPCEGNPCESRGTCLEQPNGGFQCRCHAWWEGSRCERRMMHIPYKPLSERMLHEPFWLGLITVFVVMGVIGLFWCAKRHFPEKLEKLLAEEADRNNRSTTSTLRSASVREQLAASGAASVAVTPSPGPNAPRSLFGRLGIRKPSILSLTSPHGMNHAATAARTFSLDDLLKPPPIRTPSPRKKRNNSTPTKKNAAEKKQILQQLIAPSANKNNPKKVTLGELMQLSEKKLKVNDASNANSAVAGGSGKDASNSIKETPFTNNVATTSTAQLGDPKLEKKVTFARLLNKVSAEMSSGSEIEMGTMKSSAAPSLHGAPRSASTPPSPAPDNRSPNSTSSIQGSDSLSSSDLGLPTALSSSASDLMISKKPGKFPSTSRQKPSSADSILAMFRNFSSSSAGANLPSSIKLSPSTTPTASSPQDDIAGDDESSTSSVHTPVSFSSGYNESPVHKYVNSTIEVPVLDPLKSSSNNCSNFLHPPTILLEIPSSINKCLSPIREMPTPLPSPMPTPIPSPMHRSTASSSAEDLGMENSDDRISVELPCANNSFSEGDDDSEMHTAQDIIIDLQAEDGLIQEEAVAMQQQTSSSIFRPKTRPPPLGRAAETLRAPTVEASPQVASSSHHLQDPTRRSPLVIPTLIIQTPSPTHQRHFSLPGSPPPQRAMPMHDNNFTLMPCRSSSAKRMLKEFDKPTSLDLPCAPPLITVTFNMSEVESDAESISPAVKNSGHLGPSSGGMCYLSPFSISPRNDRTTSESNLSSSGYSSMASPGPSRCGSNNPLCPSEMEDPGPSGPGAHYPMGRRPSPLLRTTTSTEGSSSNTDQREHGRGRSDSETLSDDPLLESNDEGIGTDHIDEKIEEGELKSAKELQVFIGKELFDCGKTILDSPLLPTCIINSPKGSKCGSISDNLDRLTLPHVAVCKSSLQLPSIVVQSDSSGCEKHLSPVSSRSESPLSDRTTGLNRFSPQFYGNRQKDILPFTDSDGLYDFPSSDCPPQHSKITVALPAHTQQHRKSVGRRREKKSSRCKTPSPTKPQGGGLLLGNHLDIPGHRTPSPRKPSPKRRARTQLISSSSSSESITSAREMRLSSSSPSPDTVRWSSPLDWPIDLKASHKSPEASGEETGEDMTSAMLPKGIEEISKPVKRISRLRTISHQIRFLRRLEISLKRRERAVSPSDSVDSDNGEDSPRATSPLLQPYKESKKATGGSSSQTRAKRNKFRRSGEMLLGDDDRSWTPVAVTGTGHSD